MNLLPGWHPLVVHFPLALVVTGAVCLLAARVVNRDAWVVTMATVGTWNLCLGALAALIALGTGLAAVLRLEASSAAHQAISTHMKWALFTSLALILLAVWRGAGTAQNSRPTWLFILVLWAATGALCVTGYFGAQNVYRFGIGVFERTTSLIAAPAVPTPWHPAHLARFDLGSWWPKDTA